MASKTNAYIAYGDSEKPPLITPEQLAEHVGPGWKDLILDLCSELRTVHGWDGNIYQIKEKFGGLRFYADGFEPEGRSAIASAEGKSYTICEECGDPGVPRGGGWVKTFCNKHAGKRKKIEW
jgi:hypothetical protein